MPLTAVKGKEIANKIFLRLIPNGGKMTSKSDGLGFRVGPIPLAKQNIGMSVFRVNYCRA
jgi:hypothetical protein